MTIVTEQSLVGFVITPARLSPCGDTQRIDLTVGQPRDKQLPDGTVARADPERCHLTMTGPVAARSQAALTRVGTYFVAAGRMTTEQVYNPDAGRFEDRAVFVASRIGTDTLSYADRRTPDLGRAMPARPTAPKGPASTTPAPCPAPGLAG